MTKYICEECYTESCTLDSNDSGYLPTDYPDWCPFKKGKEANFTIVES